MAGRGPSGQPDPVADGVEDPGRARRDLDVDGRALGDLRFGVDPDRHDHTALDVGGQEDVGPDRFDQLDHRREGARRPFAREEKLLGADPDGCRTVGEGGPGQAGQLDRDGSNEAASAAGRLDPAVEDVHRRAAHERGDEAVRRPAIDPVGRPDLLDQAMAHDHDPIGHRHRLDLVVGHVDRRPADPLVEAEQLGAHLDPEQGVEVGQWLVHQEGERLTDDRPAERHPLALAAGQLVGVLVELAPDLEEGCRGLDLPVDLGLRPAGHLEREAEVAADGHVWVEGVVLEDHRHVPGARLEVVGELAADVHLTVRGVLETGDDLEQGAFAAARRPEQDHELARLDVQVDAAQGGDLAVLLGHAQDLDRVLAARGGIGRRGGARHCFNAPARDLARNWRWRTKKKTPIGTSDMTAAADHRP
jgi:hypothetical protein